MFNNILIYYTYTQNHVFSEFFQKEENFLTKIQLKNFYNRFTKHGTDFRVFLV